MSVTISAWKTFTWCLIASVDTILGVIVILTLSKGEEPKIIASYIAAFEVVSKLILYYIHERIWEKAREFKELRVTR